RIDMVVANAEGGNDLEFWKQPERPGIAAHRIVGDRRAADLARDIRRQPLQIVRRLEMMQHELVGKTIVDDRLAWSVDQQIDLLGRNSSGRHQVSFPSALSCQRRNKRYEISASRA